MNVLNASLVEPSSCFQGDFTRRGFGLGEKEMTKPKRLRGGDATWTMDQLFCHVLRQCKLCHLEPFISRYLLSNPQYAGHNQTSWNSRKKQTSWVLGCLLLRLLRLQHQVHLFFCPGSAAGAAALKYIYIYITANHLKIEASQILDMQGKKHRLAICSNDFESDNYFCLCQADDTKRTPWRAHKAGFTDVLVRPASTAERYNWCNNPNPSIVDNYCSVYVYIYISDISRCCVYI